MSQPQLPDCRKDNLPLHPNFCPLAIKKCGSFHSSINMTSNLLPTADFSRFPVRRRFLLNSSLRSLNSDRWVQRLQRFPKTVCQMEKDYKIQAFYHKKTFQSLIQISSKVSGFTPKNMLDLCVQHVLTTQINFTATSFPTLSDIYLDPRRQQTWTLACNQLVGTSTCRVLCQSACSVLTLML